MLNVTLDYQSQGELLPWEAFVTSCFLYTTLVMDLPLDVGIIVDDPVS